MGANPLAVVLSDLIRVPGITGAYLVSPDGFVVEKASAGTENIDDDALAAMVVAVFGSTTQLGETLQVGRPEVTSVEYPGHYILLYALRSNHLLIVVADRSKAILGRIRFEVKRQAQRLSGML